MDTFKTIYEKTVNESVVSIDRNSLDPTVFQFFDDGREPILTDGIKSQILKNMDTFSSIANVLDFYMVGSILTKRYNENSDIDVNIKIDGDTMDEMARANLLAWVKKTNGALGVGTTHPINYYITFEEIDETKFDAIYDIINERWVKNDLGIDPAVSAVAEKFFDTVSSIDVATGQLKRDLVDILEIEKMGQTKSTKLKLLIKNKLDNLNTTIQTLSNSYESVMNARKDAYNRELSLDEIKEIGSRNNLPDNVIYKLLEKYYYLKYLKKINAIYNENKNIKNKSQIKNLAQLVRDANLI